MLAPEIPKHDSTPPPVQISFENPQKNGEDPKTRFRFPITILQIHKGVFPWDIETNDQVFDSDFHYFSVSSAVNSLIKVR